MKHIGRYLKNYIEEKKMVKKQVAQDMGISTNYLSMIFSKASIDSELLEKFAVVLGLDLSQVFDKLTWTKSSVNASATALFGSSANVSVGGSEALLLQLLAEKERTIQILTKQLDRVTGTSTEQNV